MGKVLPKITEREAKFISQQKVFFVATSPLSPNHRVNVSPKAPGTSVIVLTPHEVAYADLTGSGSETSSHVLENGRMTLMFCNLEQGPPNILRLYGYATVIFAEDVSKELLERFPKEITSSTGFRCVYRLRVDRISTSCGYSLPVMKFERQRETLNETFAKMSSEEVSRYRTKKNSFSIDGLRSTLGDETRVVPRYEDGYYFGAIVEGNETLMQQLRRKLGNRMQNGKNVAFRPMLAHVTTFLLGSIFGMIICHLLT